MGLWPLTSTPAGRRGSRRLLAAGNAHEPPELLEDDLPADAVLLRQLRGERRRPLVHRLQHGARAVHLLEHAEPTLGREEVDGALAEVAGDEPAPDLEGAVQLA